MTSNYLNGKLGRYRIYHIPIFPAILIILKLKKPLRGFALAQTYIPAQTLEQQIKSGRIFTEAEVKQIGTKLLDILIYLHSVFSTSYSPRYQT